MNALNIQCLKHLCLRLKISKDALQHAMQNIDSLYKKRKFVRKGKEREVLIAHRSIKKIHKAILLILNPLALHPAAHGWRKGRSTPTNAAPHLGKNAHLCLDLKDCYPNIHSQKVLHLFEKILGCSKKVAFYLTRLTTYEHSLAQGLSTSGAIVNLLMRDVDNKLHKMATDNGFAYTRYGDDITFSGDYISENFASHIKNILKSHGFENNSQKEHLSHGTNKPIITGINIAGKSPKVPRCFKKKLRAAEKELSTCREPVKNLNLLQSVRGRRQHIKYVESSMLTP